MFGIFSRVLELRVITLNTLSISGDNDIRTLTLSKIFFFFKPPKKSERIKSN
jgi:hypothetical protein